MADARNTMMEPAIEDLLDRTDSKFTLVILAALRGREINSYFNQLGEGLGSLVPPQVASVARKPLSIAFEEIAAGKATYRRIDSVADEGGEPSVDPDGAAEASVGEASVGEVSVGEVSVGEVSVGEDGVGEDGVGEDGVGEASVGEASVGEASVGEDGVAGTP